LAQTSGLYFGCTLTNYKLCELDDIFSSRPAAFTAKKQLVLPSNKYLFNPGGGTGFERCDTVLTISKYKYVHPEDKTIM
jgi:hypothetical protein